MISIARPVVEMTMMFLEKHNHIIADTINHTANESSNLVPHSNKLCELSK